MGITLKKDGQRPFFFLKKNLKYFMKKTELGKNHGGGSQDYFSLGGTGGSPIVLGEVSVHERHSWNILFHSLVSTGILFP